MKENQTYVQPGSGVWMQHGVEGYICLMCRVDGVPGIPQVGI